MISDTYFSVTTIISDQNRADSTPSTFSWVSGSACVPVNAVRSV